jgi:NADH dehydrogenase [ubiquinone] 1 alpha subcomplex assembly factor 5
MIRLTKYAPSFIRRYSVKIFDRNVKINQRDWACSDIESSKQVDYLKDEVASRMVDRLLVNAPMTYDQFTLKDIKRRFNRILEMGAGTGHISKIIDDELCKELVVVEASSNCESYDIFMLFRHVQQRLQGTRIPE